MYKTVITSIIGMFFWSGVNAQSFYKAEKITTTPSQLICDNYTSIELKGSKGEIITSNVIDKNNPYTFIQYLRDANGMIFQILYQTDFLGKHNVIAISNNMNELFRCNGKPSIGFDFCISKVNENDFPEKQIEEIINCILSRINSCKP